MHVRHWKCYVVFKYNVCDEKWWFLWDWPLVAVFLLMHFCHPWCAIDCKCSTYKALSYNEHWAHFIPYWLLLCTIQIFNQQWSLCQLLIASKTLESHSKEIRISFYLHLVTLLCCQFFQIELSILCQYFWSIKPINEPILPKVDMRYPHRDFQGRFQAISKPLTKLTDKWTLNFETWRLKKSFVIKTTTIFFIFTFF